FICCHRSCERRYCPGWGAEQRAGGRRYTSTLLRGTPRRAMTPTVRLYHDDPLLLDFTATVIGHGALNGAPSVLLDRSAFYPESGGQMADRGRLGGAEIADVQVDDDGRVHHVLEGGALLDVGASVVGGV